MAIQKPGAHIKWSALRGASDSHL